MKRKVIAASAAALIGLSTIACSQPYGGMGPGMMGGYGPGPNQEQGRGPGYGPGGYGPGYGPGGYGPGYGMGPGMMGGYGPGYGYGMGPGMMGGYGYGYGMGPGMMGGYGYGMGPGMMGGYGPGYGYGPKLSDEQRAKIAEIQQDITAKRWELMEKMHDEGSPMWRAYGPGPIDEKAARKSYDEMAAAQKQMFELQLQARKRIDAVLTPEQREQMYRGWGKR
jgi:Spy/CpxP family protein refolding chaperone